MTCPQCQCSEWKLASLVYNEGFDTTRGQSTGIGVGITTGGLGIGAGTSTSTGYQQSNLSRLAAPPVGPNEGAMWDGGILGFIIACTFFGLALVTGGIQNLNLKTFVIGLALFLPLVCWILIYKRINRRLVQHEKDVSNWANKKMCTRCGYFYS